eukprot:symbB.v1.2.029057.t1/scaffold3142.1/size62523/2
MARVVAVVVGVATRVAVVVGVATRVAVVVGAVAGKRRLRKLGSLRQDNFGWGHGVAGETCCMCYKQFRHKKLMFAGGDWHHHYGNQSAHQHCDAVCEHQCRRIMHKGHKFGCYEEDDLHRKIHRWKHNPHFKIKHEKRYGNIC